MKRLRNNISESKPQGFGKRNDNRVYYSNNLLKGLDTDIVVVYRKCLVLYEYRSVFVREANDFQCEFPLPYPYPG